MGCIRKKKNNAFHYNKTRVALWSTKDMQLNGVSTEDSKMEVQKSETYINSTLKWTAKCEI